MTETEINVEIMKRLGIVTSESEIKFGGSKLYSCPYHKDNHPSCSIDAEKGLFNCFSCGNKGTLRRVFRDIEGVSINKALGIPWDKQDDSELSTLNRVFGVKKEFDEPDYDETPPVHIGLTGTFIRAEDCGEAKAYLEKRCIPLNVAKAMKMKYATIGKTYDLLDPENLKRQVNFSGRLIIPIYENNKLISCEGRDISGERAFLVKMKRLGYDNVDYKKCIYPVGSSTSSLYQLNKLDEKSELYFMEGLMDLAVLRSDSYFNEKNSTAVFGASLSHRQQFLLSKFSKTCFIIDNDLAGWTSLMRWKDYIVKNNLGRNHYYLVPPFADQGVKDIGDIPVKTGKTIEQCRKMRWVKSQRSILDDKDKIDARARELYAEKWEK